MGCFGDWGMGCLGGWGGGGRVGDAASAWLGGLGSTAASSLATSVASGRAAGRVAGDVASSNGVVAKLQARERNSSRTSSLRSRGLFFITFF